MAPQSSSATSSIIQTGGIVRSRQKHELRNSIKYKTILVVHFQNPTAGGGETLFICRDRHKAKMPPYIDTVPNSLCFLLLSCCTIQEFEDNLERLQPNRHTQQLRLKHQDIQEE